MAGETVASLNTSGRAVAKNALSSYVTLFSGALLGFVLTPILLHKLGTIGFGTWSLVLGAAAYLGLVEVGLGLATITRVAASETEGPEALSRVLSTSLALCCGVAAVGAVLAVGLCIVFPLLFNVPSDLADSARIAVLLVGASQCLMLVANVYSACLLGLGRMYLVNFRGFAVSALVSVAQIAVLYAGGGLEEIAAVVLAGGVLTFAVFRWQVHRSLPELRITPRGADRAVARRLLSLGWRNSISSFSSVLAFGSDVLLVGLLLNPTAAAAYAVALRVYTLMSRISTGAFGAIGPAHAYAARNATSERRFRLYCLSLSVALPLALVAAVTVAVYARPLLDLWLGTVPPDAAYVLVLLCAVLVLQTPGTSAYSLLLASEKAGMLMRITLLAATCNVIGSVAFTLGFGTIGPALGSLAAVLLFDAVYLPRRICTLLDESYSELARRILLPLALPLLALGAVLAVGRSLVAEGPWVLAVAVAGGLAFFGAWWFTDAARDIRRIVLRRRSEAASGVAAQSSGVGEASGRV